MSHVLGYPTLLCSSDSRLIFCDESDGERESNKKIERLKYWSIEISKNDVSFKTSFFFNKKSLAIELYNEWNEKLNIRIENNIKLFE